MRQGIALKKIIEYVARKASMLSQRYSLDDLVTPSIVPMFDKSIDKIVSVIVRNSNGLWCGLCEKGPFTKRGLYLHLIRVHSKDIEYMVHDELKKLLEIVKR